MSEALAPILYAVRDQSGRFQRSILCGGGTHSDHTARAIALKPTLSVSRDIAVDGCLLSSSQSDAEIAANPRAYSRRRDAAVREDWIPRRHKRRDHRCGRADPRGAMLYHFTTREELVEALIPDLERLHAQLLEDSAAEAARPGVDAPEHAIDVDWALKREVPFVAFSELEAAERTDPMVRQRLMSAQSAFDHAQAAVSGSRRWCRPVPTPDCKPVATLAGSYLKAWPRAP